MNKYKENDYLLVNKNNVFYRKPLFGNLKFVFDSEKAIKNAVVVAYTNSDTLNPNIVLYTDLEELRSVIKNWVMDYVSEAGVVNDYAKDDEIDEFIENLRLSKAGNKLALQLVEDDYEVVATALVLGGNNE